jgi:CBS domain-containing protein
MLVRDVLRSKSSGVISIAPEATVREAIDLMVLNNIGSLPVVDETGTLVGVFSERDVLRQIHHGGNDASRVVMAEVMTRNPVTCQENEDVDEVMGKMSERRIAKVPVMRQGRLVGVISVGDMIKVSFERVRSENHHLMNYIHGSY